jgi:membrane protease YdiL (CAAX protease family)
VTDWVGFLGFTGVVLTLMLALAWVSRDALEADSVVPPTESTATESDRQEAIEEFNRVMGGPAPGPGEPRPREPGEARPGDHQAEARTEAATVEAGAETGTVDSEPETVEAETTTSDRMPDADELSTGTLLANVVITQGLFFGLLVIGLWWAEVPAVALGLASAGTAVPGVAVTSLGASPTAIGLGVALGTGLYVFNQLGASLGDRVGIDSSTALREALAPASAGGWAGLLGIVLPIVAVFEELLFRGALIGGLAVASVELGLAVSPWLFVVGSAVAFAVGHGAQGRGGIVVTGALGGVLGAAFVLTWSLPLVIVAHYVVNALEFVIHEGLEMDWI